MASSAVRVDLLRHAGSGRSQTTRRSGDDPEGHGLFRVQLETRIYAPPGDCPFPLVIINHGKDPGDPHFQQSSSYDGQALEFVRRGYAVIVPMRQGFAKSGGFYRSSCNIEDNGLAQAEDVLAAIAYAKTLPYVDATRIAVIGSRTAALPPWRSAR
jgi:dienelactone hydrolase